MCPDPLLLPPGMRARSAPMDAEMARQLEAHLPELRRVARQLSQSWSRADDLVQETLMALWERSDQLDPAPERLRQQAFETLKSRATARAPSSPEFRDIA